MSNLEQKEKKMNPLAHAVPSNRRIYKWGYSCFFQTL
jgi:hypothetical protein